MKYKLEFLIMVPFLLVMYPIMAFFLLCNLYYNSLKIVAQEGISGLKERFDAFNDIAKAISGDMNDD